VFGFLLCVVFLVGCSNEQTFEGFFHQEMKRMHKNENFSYALVHAELNAVHEDDAIAVFKEHNTIPPVSITPTSFSICPSVM
jgi:hypothetical protein